MKHTKLIVPTAILCWSLALNAQTSPSITEPKTKLTGLKNIQIYTGSAWDRYNHMDMTLIQDRTQNTFEYKNETNGMKKNMMHSSIGLNTGLNLSFHAPKLSNELVSAAFRLGGAVNLMKESLIEFRTEQPHPKEKSSLMYCFVENDARLNSDLLFEVKTNRIFSVYSGLGFNASTSFGNKLLIMQNYEVNTGVINEFTPNGSANDDKQILQGKSVIYTRAYIPMGLNLKLYKNLESTFEVKFGRGLEKVINGKTQGFKTREISLGLKYNFNLL